MLVLSHETEAVCVWVCVYVYIHASPIYFFTGVWLTSPVCMVLLWVNRAHFYTRLTPSLHCLCVSELIWLSLALLYTGSCSCGKGQLHFIWLTGYSDVDLCVCLCVEGRQREYTQTMQINASTMDMKIYQFNNIQMKWKKRRKKQLFFWPCVCV